MKTAKLLAVAIATLASIPLMAQQVNAAAQQSATGSAAGTQVNDSAQGGTNANVNHGRAQASGSADSSLAAEGRNGTEANASGSAADAAEMRPVNGELEGKLDSKNARVGEPVVLKTTEKTKTADGMVIPKGSRLMGHVTEVQAHEKGHEQSSMGLQFDRVELKNGQSYAIHSMIESVRPSEAAMEASSMANEDAFAGGPGGGAMGGGEMAGGGHAMAGGHGGGLLGGGGGGGLAGGAAATTGRIGSGVSSGLDSTAGGTVNGVGRGLNATGNIAGNAAGDAGRGVYGATSGVGSLGMHATGIPGVMLNSSAMGGASGMFTAAKRNIHFDSGTQMVVGVAAAR